MVLLKCSKCPGGVTRVHTDTVPSLPWVVLDGGQDPAPHQGSVRQERGRGSGHPPSTKPSGGEQSPGVDVAGLMWGARGQVGWQDPSGEGLSGYNNKAGESIGAMGGLGGGEAPRGNREASQ